MLQCNGKCSISRYVKGCRDETCRQINTERAKAYRRTPHGRELAKTHARARDKALIQLRDNHRDEYELYLAEHLKAEREEST